MQPSTTTSSITSPLKIAVMGAGAVGCYFGGMLARAGHDVTLIGRPDHVRAIEQNGLRLQTLHFDEQVPLSASTEVGAIADASLVLFCVKSTDTESTALQMRPHLAPDALLLTLQNGVDNAERLRALLPQPIAAAVVYVGTAMAGPGHVQHHGRGELVIEPTARSEAIARMLVAAGVPTQISDNVRGSLWAKLILNCAYNAISAIAQAPYRAFTQDADVQRVMRDVVDECQAVARADGVELLADAHASVRQLAHAMPDQYSSTAQDLARGKRSEIDHLNGYVIRRGETLGVSTPANRVLHAMVKLIETSSPASRG